MKSWKEFSCVFEREEFLEKIGMEGRVILEVELFDNQKVKIVTK